MQWTTVLVTDTDDGQPVCPSFLPLLHHPRVFQLEYRYTCHAFLTSFSSCVSTAIGGLVTWTSLIFEQSPFIKLITRLDGAGISTWYVFLEKLPSAPFPCSSSSDLAAGIRLAHWAAMFRNKAATCGLHEGRWRLLGTPEHWHALTVHRCFSTFTVLS